MGFLAALALTSGLACAPGIRPGEPGHPSGGAATTAPPGGLAPEQVPQFVHFQILTV